MTDQPTPPRAHYIWLYVSACVFLGTLGLATQLEGLLVWLLPLSTGLSLMARILILRDARRQAADAASRRASAAR